MGSKRRYFIPAGLIVFVASLLLGIWIGGADWEAQRRVTPVGTDRFATPESSLGLRPLPDPDFEGRSEQGARESALDAPREKTRREKMLANFPFEFDEIAPQILEDLDRIAEADTANSVPPELQEELEEQLGLDDVVNPNRAIVDMAAQMMVDTQRAYEVYLEADQEVAFPSEDELQRMREIRDQSVPTPSQWELLGGRPDSAQDPSAGTGEQPSATN